MARWLWFKVLSWYHASLVLVSPCKVMISVNDSWHKERWQIQTQHQTSLSSFSLGNSWFSFCWGSLGMYAVCTIMQTIKCLIIYWRDLRYFMVFHCVEDSSAAKQNSQGPARIFWVFSCHTVLQTATETPTSPQAPGCMDYCQKLAGISQNITTLISCSLTSHQQNSMESEPLGTHFPLTNQTIPKRF